MTAKQIVLEQLRACSNTNAWFVSAAGALRGLDAARASRKGGEDGHSVWNVVNHIVYWNDRYLARFTGKTLDKAVSSEATFQGPRSSGTDAQWQATVAELDRVMAGWIGALETADDARLDGKVRAEGDETWVQALTNMTIHTAYHVGQIVTLRKEHGDWDPAQGVS